MDWEGAAVADCVGVAVRRVSAGGRAPPALMRPLMALFTGALTRVAPILLGSTAVATAAGASQGGGGGNSERGRRAQGCMIESVPWLCAPGVASCLGAHTFSSQIR